MTESTSKSPAIILVDDEPEILFSSTVMLRRAGLDNIRSMEDSRDLLGYLGQHDAGVIVLDLQMPYVSGKELLDQITSAFPHIPVIIVTAANELETAVDCMKNGAFDYMVKPIEGSRFVGSIRKALEMNSMRQEIASLRECLLVGRTPDEKAFAPVITRSARMKAILGYLEVVATTGQPVLITGETGVGKELIALAVHELSGRSGQFTALNIAGLDDAVFTDTLFGHTKGAFTGADQAREGMIAQAAGGTLFLDEIGDMGMGCQVKLLRLLQEGQYHPLGSDVARTVNTRIIAATNSDLEILMDQGKFRKDLYYRLCAHRAHIPPLRERPEDIPLLVETFIAEAALFLDKKKPSYPPELLIYLATYDFPGNVRELKAMTFDAVARHKGGMLSLASIMKLAVTTPGHAGTALCGGMQKLNLTGRFPTLKEMEDSLMTEALTLSGGNQGAAAALLGMSRQALNKRLLRK